MPRAVLRNGVIYPLEPLPPDWTDGRQLRVEDAQEPDESPETVDQWCREMDALEAPLTDPKEVEQFQAFLAQVRQQDRQIARRQAGLG
jgi:hypothetical protein